MSQNTAPQRTPKPSSAGAWAAGGTLFAGVLMLVTGFMDIFQGIAGIAEDDVYTRVGDYVFKFNLTTWGWIHLILGVIVAIAGYGILKGAEWGRVAGIALASLNVLFQFLFLPYQPWWALFSMAISVFVIWALATDEAYGRHEKF
ncbi:MULTISPECIES: DUF7144 family membrane protein [Streptomyces]|uniref:Integral membrane protein n=1 Tax=Streptomyces venezuelae (strain ATCC 10712 / CBS 650.69 / DSM 40230 / JCM 4526 / NBRC 13096 / PD 04745) TaxID=953739 RepID=F2RBW6_STRVP|nr:hypothetical protein [Streptomyces venezuelae]APE22619.1 hypothetical protein vnz_17435 [Streptomyces venezuelae]QER99996.1 hypothetical protein DEJ43_17655 [Streptomyces venezuelae ATCC 10712]QES07048.1 hypothetical protein DEJ44_16475 [Streptomyces venezuelae]CCA56827.1 integral membrane protein [Streptomyces venezuelae ATCC 10712]